MVPDTGRITELLLRWNAGDEGALEHLIPLIYNELRRMATSMLSHERPGHTLSATALVHETYLKLADQRQVNWETRAHFFGASARIMRRVLVDHAKAKRAGKRGGWTEKIAITNDIAPAGYSEDLLGLDEALDRLGLLDARKVKVVEMKFFAGMTNQEAARALGISDATVEREWKMARAWLIQELQWPSPRLKGP